MMIPTRKWMARVATTTLLASAPWVLPGALAADPPQTAVTPQPYTAGATLTRSVQAGITPEQALAILQEGNQRFAANQTVMRDRKAQVLATALGQFPLASVVGCIDSRVPPELVFDQGIGDLFVARVAGNTVNEDILGSLEYASKVAGSRLIVVLGHTSCGAIKGACDGIQMGNLSALLEKLGPALVAAQTAGERSSRNHAFVEEVTELNVRQVVERIRAESPILREMEQAGEIHIVGALYDTSSGKVAWY